MKHCEKCIHYELCKSRMECAPDDTFSFFPYNEDCPHFKNKADYVEVVRCGKCKHGEVSIMSKSKDGEEEIACYCNAKNKVTDLEYYCACGERRDT